MPYEAILFDFDGVLVDSEPVHFECWREILQEFGLDLDWKIYCDHGIGVSDRALMSLLCQQTHPPFDVERLLAEYPRKKEAFKNRMLEGQPLSEEVLKILGELDEYPLAIVTSSGQSEIEPILLKAGILDRFRAVVYGGDVTRHKPAPDPYLLALEKLGVRRGLVLEDSNAGEASARAAGLDVLRIPTPREMPNLLRARLSLNGSPGVAGTL